MPFVNIENYPTEEEMASELARHNNVVAFDMDKMAKDLGSPRSSNMVLLGAASPFIQIGAEEIEDGIRKVFGAKGEKIVESNIAAFRAGREFAQNLKKDN